MAWFSPEVVFSNDCVRTSVAMEVEHAALQV